MDLIAISTVNYDKMIKSIVYLYNQHIVCLKQVNTLLIANKHKETERALFRNAMEPDLMATSN